MDKPRIYALNPLDNVLLATHESLRQRGYCGLTVVLIADVEGVLDPQTVAAALRRVGRDYPALSARIEYTPTWGRAHWRIEPDADLASAIEYEVHDAEASGADPDKAIRAALDESLDPTAGPQVKLVHVRLGSDRHRLGLRWPHHLMDLEGAHRLLGELHRALAGLPPDLGQDPAAAPPAPFAAPFPLSIYRVWQGRRRHRRLCATHQPRLIPKPEHERKRACFRLRCYDAGFRERFEAVARERASPGPMRYSRALLLAVARTYLEMCREGGRPRSHYLFPHVASWPRLGPRPGLHGNFVTIPWFGFTAAELMSWPAADAALCRQLADYRRKHEAAAEWYMYRASQRWPFFWLRSLVMHQRPRGAAGFTSFRFDDSVTRLGDAPITKLAVAGTVDAHPGWIVGNSTHGRTMSVVLSYFQDFLDDTSATEFLDRLERRLVGD